MRPVVTNVIAGLLGMTLGWVVIADPLSAMFAPTSVTWDASSCPPGVYTITSLARSMSNGTFQTTSSANVTLPRASVVQEFPNLPPGNHFVTATARRTGGQTFGSIGQTVAGLGSPPAPGAPGGLGRSGRGRPPSAQPNGRAVPRRSDNASSASMPPQAGLSVKPAGVATPANRTTRSGKLAAAANHAFPLFQISFDEVGDFLETDADWHRLGLVDLDADGRVDVVTLELVTGDVWIIHIRR